MKIRIFFISLLFFLSATPVSAHFLISDGEVAGLIHITPDDNPPPGSDAPIHVDMRNKDGAFKIANCACTLEIRKSEVLLASFEMMAHEKESSEFMTNYTFQTPGVYELRIHGTDTVSDTSFDMKYDLRVEGRTQNAFQEPSDNTQPLLFTGILFGIIISFWFFVKK